VHQDTRQDHVSKPAGPPAEDAIEPARRAGASDAPSLAARDGGGAAPSDDRTRRVPPTGFQPAGLIRDAAGGDQEAEWLANVAAEVNDLHRRAVESALVDARRIGDILIAVKGRLPHGQFRAWVEQHCEFAPRSATNYMAVAGRWDEIESTLAANRQHAADLSVRAALKMLAGTGAIAEDTPSSVRRSAVKEYQLRRALTRALRGALVCIARDFSVPGRDREQFDEAWERSRALREQVAELLLEGDPGDWRECPYCCNDPLDDIWRCDRCRNSGFELEGSWDRRLMAGEVDDM
jgi:hypothetical protein